MPFCKEKNSRLERKAQGNKAMDKLNKRIQVYIISSCMIVNWSIKQVL